LQRIRREQASRKGFDSDDEGEGRTKGGSLEDDATVFGVPKKKKQLEDPFGPPLAG
jgi:hypothetical protein